MKEKWGRKITTIMEMRKEREKRRKKRKKRRKEKETERMMK